MRIDNLIIVSSVLFSIFLLLMITIDARGINIFSPVLSIRLLWSGLILSGVIGLVSAIKIIIKIRR